MKLELVNSDTTIVLNEFPVMIGRSRTADVCLNDAELGEFQCIIEQVDGGVSIKDIANWRSACKAGPRQHAIRAHLLSKITAGGGGGKGSCYSGFSGCEDRSGFLDFFAFTDSRKR